MKVGVPSVVGFSQGNFLDLAVETEATLITWWWPTSFFNLPWTCFVVPELVTPSLLIFPDRYSMGIKTHQKVKHVWYFQKCMFISIGSSDWLKRKVHPRWWERFGVTYRFWSAHFSYPSPNVHETSSMIFKFNLDYCFFGLVFKSGFCHGFINPFKKRSKFTGENPWHFNHREFLRKKLDKDPFTLGCVQCECFTFFHGNSPSNHHLGEDVWVMFSIRIQESQIQTHRKGMDDPGPQVFLGGKKNLFKQWNKGPWFFWMYTVDEILPIYAGKQPVRMKYYPVHELFKDPYWNNQYIGK